MGLRVKISVLAASKNPNIGYTVSVCECALLRNSVRVHALVHHYLSKGQRISKCPFGVKTSSEKPMKFFQSLP